MENKKRVLVMMIISLIMLFSFQILFADPDAPILLEPEDNAAIAGDTVTLRVQAVSGAIQYRFWVRDLTSGYVVVDIISVSILPIELTVVIL